MSYAGSFLKAYGQTCTILRNPPVNAYVSLKRATRSVRGNLGLRDAFFEGLILKDASLVAGEIFEVGSDAYLTLSVRDADGEAEVLVAKTNATITHRRYTESVDADYNVSLSWSDQNTDVKTCAQLVTAGLRQEDPGILATCRYLLLAAANLGFQVMDRVVMDGVNYRVEAIDDLGLVGIARVQLGEDTRP